MFQSAVACPRSRFEEEIMSMDTILLIDDDEDTWGTVRLALEPHVKVHAIGSLASALNFLRTRSHEVSGVIVDLNLTSQSDNFGREILARLREIGMPCVVFSSSIKTPEDAQRYANEFGVLGTIGKSGPESSPESSLRLLQVLRESVDRMITVSMGQRRLRIQSEIERELERRDTEIERERSRSEELVAETRRVAGTAAAAKLSTMETERIDSMVSDATSFRSFVVEELESSKTNDDLERIRRDIMQTLGVM
jgi:CheY-like chemotaxis protein